MSTFFIILTSLLLLAKQDSPDYKIGEKLSSYFPLDNINQIELTNWKGKKDLNGSKRKLFIEDLKTYICDKKYADTKPGHLYCFITFKNHSGLHFYSNSSADIIILKDSLYFTFISKKKIDFEKY